MQESKESAVVLGLGGGGGRIAAALAARRRSEQYRVAVADCDRHELAEITGVGVVALGEGWDCDEGCGGDPELGERMVSGAEAALVEAVGATRLLIVVAGLGGGVGTGGARVLARIARDRRLPALFVLTLPFSFEGNWPRRQAEEALAEIRETTDTAIVIHNDLLFTAVAADIPAKEAFAKIDELLAQALSGVVGIAWADWLLKADFATIRKLLRENPERCDLGFGTGEGQDRWRQAVESFVECPLLGGPEHIRQVDAAIITVGSGDDLSVAELRECMAAVQESFSEEARILVGAYATPMQQGRVQITGLCCRLRSSAMESVSRGEDRVLSEDPSLGRQRGSAQNLKSLRAAGRRAPVQEELPFPEEALGIFSGIAPTTVRGENLDSPTFQRRNIKLNLAPPPEV